MRSLATGHYTHAQVDAALRANQRTVQPRFDVLDNSNNKLGELTTVGRKPGDAVVEFNGDRAVKDSLDLRMLPDESLRGQLYKRRIQPWFRIRMPDGGWAEFTEGVYLWSTPEADLSTNERWNITLGDLNQLINEDGPPLSGFTIFVGEPITDSMKRIWTQAGFDDVSGIVDHPQRATISYTWIEQTPKSPAYIARERIETTMREQNVPQVTQDSVMNIVKLFAPDVDTAQATWLNILELLCSGLGYHPPFIDLDGRPRCIPATDLPPEVTVAVPGDLVAVYELLTTPSADLAYDTDKIRSIIVRDSAQVGHNLQGLANRVRLVASANPDFTGVQDFKAEQLNPSHPLAYPSIGRYITKRLDDSTTFDPIQLLWKTLIELVKGMSMFRTITFKTLANPAHEGFETLTFQYDGHPDFQEPVLSQESMWAIDLNTGIQEHGVRQVGVSPIEGIA